MKASLKVFELTKGTKCPASKEVPFTCFSLPVDLRQTVTYGTGIGNGIGNGNINLRLCEKNKRAPIFLANSIFRRCDR
jgi:hypothetical protein